MPWASGEEVTMPHLAKKESEALRAHHLLKLIWRVSGGGGGGLGKGSGDSACEGLKEGEGRKERVSLLVIQDFPLRIL